MACVIAFNILYPNHEFAALMIGQIKLLIPAKMAANAAKIPPFSLCVLVTIGEYKSSDANLTVSHLAVLKI